MTSKTTKEPASGTITYCFTSFQFKLRIMKFALVMLTAKLLLNISPCTCDFEDSELLNLPASFEWGTNLTYGFKFRADRRRFTRNHHDPLNFHKTGCVR